MTVEKWRQGNIKKKGRKKNVLQTTREMPEISKEGSVRKGEKKKG